LKRDFARDVAVPANESMLARPVLKAILCESCGDPSACPIVDVPRLTHKSIDSLRFSHAEESAAPAWDRRLN